MKRVFPQLQASLKLPQEEERILEFWRKNKIFEKSLEKNKGKKRFVFFEGPPTANAAPGLHHVEARAFKDLFPRYKTMRGFFVERKAGWDTHGLPVEIAVERELGLKSKEEIEKFGIARFNALAKKHVWSFKKEWEVLTERIAFWLDLKEPYITYQPAYIETLWWIIKQIWEKGLLYKGHKVVPHCPRCGTALSSHEVALGYRKIGEDSVFVKFRLKPGQKINKQRIKHNVYILSWTTTPWTLPGNVALAVGKDIEYGFFENPGPAGPEILIAAKKRARSLGLSDATRSVRGKDLVGLSYEPLFDISSLKSESSCKVYPADFVTTEDGTGIVHTAVMYGEDDYRLGEEFNLPTIHTVDEAGRFLPSVQKWAGRFVKEPAVEKEIIEDLRARGLLFRVLRYAHDYPFCWRCETPLLYYAKHSWFLRISALRRELFANNQKINWVPAHLREGRFGEWLKAVKDWAISRERYWGTPLPIWENKKGDFLVIGSFAELKKLAKDKKQVGKNFDPHRPQVDKIILVKDGQEYQRVPEVVDVWFDSGAMPFGQWHYPFENRDKIDKQLAFPADFISEGVDQTRGWFYTLLAISTLLGKGPSFRNVISLGHVLDQHGKKMSKSKGNVIYPSQIIDRTGADALRFYFYSVNQPGLPKNFNPKDVEEVVRNLIFKFWNSLVFFTTYAPLVGFVPSLKPPQPKSLLDRWMLAVVGETTRQVTKALDEFDVYSAAQSLLRLADELSNWYLRRSRKRLSQPDNKKEALSGFRTLYFVLQRSALLLAPFTPFLAERLFQVLHNSRRLESVHLANWPKVRTLGLRERRLMGEMERVKTLAEEALRLREEAKIRVRQPLATLYLRERLSPEMQEILAEEVNVQVIKFSASFPRLASLKQGKRVALDTALTPALVQEGLLREAIRFVQQRRKELGLTVQDKVRVRWYAEDAGVREFFRRRAQELLEATRSHLEEKPHPLAESITNQHLSLALQVEKL